MPNDPSLIWETELLHRPGRSGPLRGVSATGASVEADHEPVERVSAAPGPPGVPDRSMIVPIEAWERMLLQLGNLHEAGQQLAEARERAAKAETEARFLREQLAELRDATSPRRPPVAERDETQPETAPSPVTADPGPAPSPGAVRRRSAVRRVWDIAITEWVRRRGR